eukprot:g19883.t1
MRGQRQTTLQWNVLVTIALGMSAFVLAEDSSDQGAFQPIGLVFVVAKVFFSCLCAVLAEKHLKAFKEMPIYAQAEPRTMTALTFQFSESEHRQQA